MPPSWAQGHRAPLGYHRTMIEDPHRMDAYERALRALVRPGDVVLDVGAGTGILSMMAARRGAARVHAVESMPIARLAAELVRRNGLEGRVIVHEAEATTLAPIEPVDLVVSDFMGRFVVDDGMLPAMAAAARWLKPGGRFCPSRTQLLLAPMGNMRIEMIDMLGTPVYGLQLAGALPYALNDCYATSLWPECVIGDAQPYVSYSPPTVSEPFDREVELRMEKDGHLRAIAGWFTAEMAPGVTISTEPGFETHWGQYLFPLPETPIRRGDKLRVRLTLVESAEDLRWRWRGEVRRGDERLCEFDLESRPALGERIGPGELLADEHDRAAALEANRVANEAFAAGRLDEAVRWWEEAARLLGPGDDDLAPALYENIGIAWYNLGRDGAAIRAFLRALDGDLGRREQSLRLLIECATRAGRNMDARRWRDEYGRRFGAAP